MSINAPKNRGPSSEQFVLDTLRRALGAARRPAIFRSARGSSAAIEVVERNRAWPHGPAFWILEALLDLSLRTAKRTLKQIYDSELRRLFQAVVMGASIGAVIGVPAGPKGAAIGAGVGAVGRVAGSYQRAHFPHLDRWFTGCSAPIRSIDRRRRAAWVGDWREPWKRSKNVLPLGRVRMTYVCNYCGTEHADETNSDEHVVPEKLLNSTLVLPDVCRRWNNFFARDFETPVMFSDFMRDVLLEFNEPPRGVQYLGTVETARGTTEHRWLVNGEERLRDMPDPQRVDVVTIHAFDAHDRPHPVQVRIPFKITAQFRGDDSAIADERRKIEKQKERLLAHITELARDPSKDPELKKQLDEHVLHLRAPKSVSFEETLSAGSGGGAVEDILPKTYVLDAERWTKFYMKIAWCFACLRLGRGRLVDLGGEPILGYLRSGVVHPGLVDTVHTLDALVAKTLFREASIDGEIVWLWAGSIDDAKQLVASAGADVSAAVAPELQRREMSHRVASTWVKALGVLDRAVGVPGAKHRYHRLRLRRLTSGEQAAIVCEIQLFSGICEATVQLTPRLAPEKLDGVEDAETTIHF